MTYKVFGGTLSLTQSINQSRSLSLYFTQYTVRTVKTFHLYSSKHAVWDRIVRPEVWH